MTTVKQYNFTLPDRVGQIIDKLPKGVKAKFVAEAIEEKVKNEAKEKVLKMLENLEPVKTGSNKTSVELINEARNARTETILNN